MRVSRRQFITSLVVAPAVRVPQMNLDNLTKLYGKKFYSFDIETVPMPKIFYIDSVTEVWEILRQQGKVK